MLTPYTERQKTMIVNNVIKAVKDPEKLSKQGYDFLYLCSGFIAHYNRKGFIGHYRWNSLGGDILHFADWNEWRNFTPNDQNYEYYKSKADIYNRIVDSLTKGV
jgi:hypothetical protein